jgi:hypothetical protein
MTKPEIQLTESTDPQDTDMGQYQAVSGLAVAGLLVGLASPAALGHPLLWTVPLVAMVICALALRRIAREAPALIGRKAALTGLALAVLFLAAAPLQGYTYGRLLDWEGRRFAAQWFELVRQNQREKSFELTRQAESRLPLDEDLPSRYPPDSDPLSELNGYLQQPSVQALLALGDKAQVRYYDTERSTRSNRGDVIKQVYAVTYEEDGERKSFFVELSMNRRYVADPGRAFWQLTDFTAPIRPKALGGEEA